MKKTVNKVMGYVGLILFMFGLTFGLASPTLSILSRPNIWHAILFWSLMTGILARALLNLIEGYTEDE